MVTPCLRSIVRMVYDPHKEVSATKAGLGYEKTWEPVAAAFLAGRSGTVTASAKAYFTPEIIDSFTKDRAARGGKASGASRRAKSAETWQANVKAEALRLRDKKPRISQAKLATEILFQLGEGALPSHAIIVRHISTLERNGELPRRRS
jgi:hypothetical protein